jgi:hypothetical protein
MSLSDSTHQTTKIELVTLRNRVTGLALLGRDLPEIALHRLEVVVDPPVLGLVAFALRNVGVDQRETGAVALRLEQHFEP